MSRGQLMTAANLIMQGSSTVRRYVCKSRPKRLAPNNSHPKYKYLLFKRHFYFVYTLILEGVVAIVVTHQLLFAASHFSGHLVVH